MRLGFASNKMWFCKLCQYTHEVEGGDREELFRDLLQHLRILHQRFLLDRQERLGPRDPHDRSKPREVVLLEVHGVGWRNEWKRP